MKVDVKISSPSKELCIRPITSSVDLISHERGLKRMVDNFYYWSLTFIPYIQYNVRRDWRSACYLKMIIKITSTSIKTPITTMDPAVSYVRGRLLQRSNGKVKERWSEEKRNREGRVKKHHGLRSVPLSLAFLENLSSLLLAPSSLLLLRSTTTSKSSSNSPCDSNSSPICILSSLCRPIDSDNRSSESSWSSIICCCWERIWEGV